MKKTFKQYLFSLLLLYIVMFFIFGWVITYSFLYSAITKLGSVELTTYRGDGYTISYPKGWTVKEDKELDDVSIDNNEIDVFISTYDNTSKIYFQWTRSQWLEHEFSIFKLGFGNFKPTGSRQTVNLKNGTWLDAGGTIAPMVKNRLTTVTQVITVVTTHTTNAGASKAFVIDYMADSNYFDAFEQKFFQPMWQSFRFL